MLILNTAYAGFADADFMATADGLQPVDPQLQTVGVSCCPESLCGDVAAQVCNYVDNLPSGPLWDGPKEQTRAIAQRIMLDGVDITEPANLAPYFADNCPSMATYAFYMALRQRYLVDEGMRRAYFETQPHAVVENLDYWLERLGWVDCYRQNCRTSAVDDLSPYEFIGECGPEFCEDAFTEEFNRAFKYALIQALARLQRGIVENINSINWVIAPLGAALRPEDPLPLAVQEAVDRCAANGLEDKDDRRPCFGIDDMRLQIYNSAPTIVSGPVISDPCNPAPIEAPTVAAQQPYECNGETVNLYPGVLAAECIVRSMFPRNCPNIVIRTEV